MKTIPFLLALATAASLASCGGGTSSPSDGDATNASAPLLSGALDETAQSARYQACTARMNQYRQLGVWKHGGAKPGVARAAWKTLTDAERSEVFDVAGCIAAGGQVGERIVSVAEEGNGPEIGTRRVANDRDFSAEVK